ncbi:MAG: adenosine deaminase [Anaerolineae bacterium]|nr:adenosine deaminase [Anaerolineae bacterium]
MSLADYIRVMPKAELHVHLEGAVQPETLLALAEKNGVHLPASDVAGLRDWYTFRDFDHFIQIYGTICSCLQMPDDFVRITYEFGRIMAEQNIRYAEVTWTPAAHVTNGLPWEVLLASINAGCQQAHAEWGVQMRWIPDIARSSPETAKSVAEWVTSPEARDGGVVALGLGGPEVGFPPELFTDAFRLAAVRGLPGNPHAGETVGPASVWGALRALQAQRIGHGVRSVEDPELVAYLVEHQVPLEVNMTSNLCLGVYPSYAAHPIRHLIESGVCVTINSDDPALFNTCLADEYQHAVQDCGLTLEQLEDMALNAVRVSYLPEDEKSALLQDFRSEYKQLRAQYGIDGAT